MRTHGISNRCSFRRAISRAFGQPIGEPNVAPHGSAQCHSVGRSERRSYVVADSVTNGISVGFTQRRAECDTNGWPNRHTDCKPEQCPKRSSKRCAYRSTNRSSVGCTNEQPNRCAHRFT